MTTRPILTVASFALLAMLAGCTPEKRIAETSPLRELQLGNERFATDHPAHPHESRSRRMETTSKGQHPVAAIIACSDSRVPVELIFDQGIGDIFVIRVAGNVCGEDEIGSVEYAVEHLGARLVVVLGHASCGAVTAVAQQAHEHGSIEKLLKHIAPAVETARREHPDLKGDALIPAAIRQNVLHSMADLRANSEELRERLDKHEIDLVGGIYDLASGRVEWIESAR